MLIIHFKASISGRGLSVSPSGSLPGNVRLHVAYWPSPVLLAFSFLSVFNGLGSYRNIFFDRSHIIIIVDSQQFEGILFE